MKRILILVCIAFIGTVSINAQNMLKFNADKKFKIVQFTDVHYVSGEKLCDVALENMKAILDAENPDFVMFSGDVIFGKPADKSMREAISAVSERKIPFAVTFGNHDDEWDMTRKQLYDLIKEIPGNLTSTTEGLTGVTNFILPVLSSESGKTTFLLYTFDSNAYSRLQGVEGYDYIHFDQVAWYREKSREFTSKNGGTPIPSLAFFHIPLPEYNQAASDEKASLIGTRKEKACAPELNTGMFAAIREMGDIMATFVGHDHDDDYAVYWHGVMLAYGRFTGGDNVYNNIKPNGARIIELTEGERSFRTWIRLHDGNVIHDIKYPDSFLKKY
ncbi:MAG: metallophosphoesterase family protein [Prevotellaceae bacterium]|jgi:3',5'-cyclic AMP phosphodiesterase CpdA|nr:metallophosphoesterase family protein [Prevotellaceae bacterium]